ncbi:MAG: tetratricopeptide repeat protein [Chloroflexi bacterium]|nr:tetratricopeptide repeat protein [Chloroflexota bacterium]
MTELQLRLLGNLQIGRASQQDITLNFSTKAQALLCYLAETGHTQQRTTLVGLLWGERPEEDARRSLRVEFTKMRPYLDDHLDITRLTAAFLRESPYWLDTEAFTHFLNLAQTADSASERAYLREAVNLYRGEFMAGFMVSDAPDFEEWVLACRERYRQLAIQALTRLTDICLEQQDHSAGIEYAQQVLVIDSWREEAHQQLMRLLLLDGQRTAALRQYEICRQVLADELGIEPAEQTQTLAAQIRQMETGQVLADKRPFPPPTAATPTALPFQPPDLIPHFLGREAELDDLAARLADSAARPIIGLVGMGGVGKSSLAIHLAHRLRARFADGVLWADAASEPTTIAARWAAAFGYDFNSLPTVSERLAAVRRLLADKHLLIVLDDVTVAARVKPLLPEDGRSAILFTTRSADIADALGAVGVNLDVLTPENGRSLLASIIGQARVQAESAAAEEIVHGLQHLPLALSIAGRYLAARPRRRLTDFARRLSNEVERLRLLTVGDTAVLSSFNISWQALDGEHQRVFALLGVFNGRGFTAEAIAYIADLDPYLAQDRLDRLVSLSLLNEHSERHYRQHALLADFARDKIGPNDDQPIGRMVDYFRQFSRRHHADYRLLTLEWDNLDAALDIAYRRQSWEQVFEFAQMLHAAWFARGRFELARQANEWGVRAAQAVNDSYQEARALYRWGRAALEQADLQVAADLFQRSLALFRQINNPAGIADCLYDLARIAITQGELYEDVSALLVESLHIREQLGDQAGVAAVLFRQSRLAESYNQKDEAEALALQALALQEAAGDKLAMVRTLHHLTWTYIGLDGLADKAVAFADRALQLAEEVDDVGELALAWYARGGAARVQGKYDEALYWLGKSYEPLQRMGDKHSVGLVLYLKMLIYRDAARYEEALVNAEQCASIFTELGDKRRVAWTVGNIARLHHKLGRTVEVRPLLMESVALATAVQDTVWVGKMQMALDSLDEASSGE